MLVRLAAAIICAPFFAVQAINVIAEPNCTYQFATTLNSGATRGRSATTAAFASPYQMFSSYCGKAGSGTDLPCSKTRDPWFFVGTSSFTLQVRVRMKGPPLVADGFKDCFFPAPLVSFQDIRVQGCFASEVREPGYSMVYTSAGYPGVILSNASAATSQDCCMYQSPLTALAYETLAEGRARKLYQAGVPPTFSWVTMVVNRPSVALPGSMTLYVNDTLQFSETLFSLGNTANLDSLTASFSVGGDGSGSWPYGLNADVAEVRMWKLALSAADVADSIEYPVPSDSPGLGIAYHFDPCLVTSDGGVDRLECFTTRTAPRKSVPQSSMLIARVPDASSVPPWPGQFRIQPVLGNEGGRSCTRTPTPDYVPDIPHWYPSNPPSRPQPSVPSGGGGGGSDSSLWYLFFLLLLLLIPLGMSCSFLAYTFTRRSEKVDFDDLPNENPPPTVDGANTVSTGFHQHVPVFLPSPMFVPTYPHPPPVPSVFTSPIMMPPTTFSVAPSAIAMSFDEEESLEEVRRLRDRLMHTQKLLQAAENEIAAEDDTVPQRVVINGVPTDALVQVRE